MFDPARCLAALDRLPRVPLVGPPTMLHELPRLQAALGTEARLLVKRDDAIPFGFGGNKVRKLELVAARAQADGCDVLITTGGVQSNHARATAAAAVRLGMRCFIVANGARPGRLTGNALLDALFGAEVEYVATREDRMPAMQAIAERLRAEGRRSLVVPLGASTPLGALGFINAVRELATQVSAPPDYIFHSSSSAGTQAGLVAGCAILGWPTRVVGVSADEPTATIQGTVRNLLGGMGELLENGEPIAGDRAIEVDDRFVGPGYGLASDESREAQSMLARTEAIVVDHCYTAKALAGLVGWCREGRFRRGETVLFWHTGGQVAVFA
jgi:1-aminocyclopropane-1-carboxylate deaminase/D-cysteine desulfhydrase-like pyridoxal-dependent ACC family enzyme